MSQKEAIMRALMEAMSESGKTISDADRKRVMGMTGAPSKSVRPKMRERTIGGGMTSGTRGPAPMRPKTIGGGMGDGTSGIPPEKNYNSKDLERLIMQEMGGGSMEKYNKGGAVKKKSAKKPRNGCAMSGRGGSYKGMK
tara:strand:+ start:123 stop:539 length:417 start_codon:yes stop_codon:yes gene_type:complete